MTVFRDFKILKKRNILFALCLGISLVAGAEDKSIIIGEGVRRFSFVDGYILNNPFVVIKDEVVIKGTVITNGFPLSIEAKKLIFADGAKIIAFRDPETPAQAAPGADGANNNSEKPKGKELNGDPGSNGRTGSRGQNGIDGNQNPSQISIIANEVVGTVVIDASGQNGGRGGQGGRGGRGGHGGKGSTARTICPLTHLKAGNGGQGGRGGNGGQGGTGGKPGPAVPFIGRLPEGIDSSRIIITQEPGKPGLGGVGGEPGSGGAGGFGGGPDWSDCWFTPDIDQAKGKPGPNGPDGSWGPGEEKQPAESEISKPEGTRYNEVRQISSHNSYDKCGMVLGDTCSSKKQGLKEQADQGVRSFEFDLHSKHVLANFYDHSDWGIYHTTDLKSGGDHCQTLNGCLTQLKEWHDQHPDHEVITLWLEMAKDFLGPLFRWESEGHFPVDLDNNRLEWNLGGTLFTPIQLLERCPEATNIQEAIKVCGWPTLSELKGKFIVVLQGDNEAASIYLNHVNFYRGDTYVGNNGYQGNKVSFVAFDITNSDETNQHPDAIFFNLEKTNVSEAKKVYENKFVSRVWEITNQSEWNNARDNYAHHLVTEHISENIFEPRAVGSNGEPFEVMDGI